MKEKDFKLPYPTHFIVWNLEGSEETSKLVRELQTALCELAKPRDSSFRERLNHCLEQFVLNLIASSASARSRRISCPANPTFYQDHRWYLGPMVTYKAMLKVRDFLEHAELINVHHGRAARHRRFGESSSFWATSKLVSLLTDRSLIPSMVREKPHHLIRLKSSRDDDHRRKLMKFDQTPETLRMLLNLRAINESVARMKVRLDLTKRQWANMEAYRQAKSIVEGEEFVPIGDDLVTYLYRVFNNGEVRPFKDGGRFYGPEYQSIPKEYRPYITINGQPTVEVDFSAMHPTMLYAKLGMQLDHDPYDLQIGHRALVKGCVNALLNAKRSNINPLPEFDENEVGMSWRDFVKTVKAGFGPLGQFLGSGCGLKLQKQDSDIAEAVMMEFVGQGIPILTIHDSFIVPAQYQGYLTRVMKDKFHEATGFKCRTKARAISTSRRDKLLAVGRNDRRHGDNPPLPLVRAFGLQRGRAQLLRVKQAARIGRC